MKSVRIRGFSGPYFPEFGLNTDQKNSEYGNFSRSGYHAKYYLNLIPRCYGIFEGNIKIDLRGWFATYHSN